MAGDEFSLKASTLEKASNGFEAGAQKFESLKLRLTNRKGQMDAQKEWLDEAKDQFNEVYDRNVQRIERAGAQLRNIGKLIAESLEDYKEKARQARAELQKMR
jgi:uncharacterized protein YukE